MIYVIIEDKFLSEEIVSNDVEQELFDENNAFLLLKQLINEICETYLKNEKLQRIINVKKIKKRKISIDFRKNYSLKLKDCKINDDLLYVNDKIVIFENDLLQINVIKMHHDKFIAESISSLTYYSIINNQE